LAWSQRQPMDLQFEWNETKAETNLSKHYEENRYH
jgi:hypothetical protein